jgi:hypothetical protein
MEQIKPIVSEVNNKFSAGQVTSTFNGTEKSIVIFAVTYPWIQL